MRKVSRSMLATLAALQSGAHTRRKVRYLKEKALVSYLYPLVNDESVDFGLYLSSINNTVKFPGDALGFGLFVEGSAKTSLYQYNHTPGSIYNAVGGFDVDIELVSGGSYDYSNSSDIYQANGGFFVSIDSVKINI